MSRSNAPIGHPGPPIHPANAGRQPAAQDKYAEQPQYTPQGAPGQWPQGAQVPGQAPSTAAQGLPQDFYFPQQQPAAYPPAAGAPRTVPLSTQADPRHAQPTYGAQSAATGQHGQYVQQPAAPFSQQPAAQWPPQDEARALQRQSAPDPARYYAAAGQPQPGPSAALDSGRSQRQFAAQPQSGALPPQRGYPAASAPQGQSAQWAHDPRGHDPRYPDQRLGEPSLDFGSYGAPGRAGQQPPQTRRSAPMDQQAYPQQGQNHHPYPAQQQPADPAYAEQDDYEEEYVEEEPRRGRRGLLVVAALVGAIGLGGSMAYVYKTYGKSFGGGNPPLVKADAQPAKTKPPVPGGKEFPNADRKIFGRLGEDTAQATQSAAAPETQADGGPRKVQTIAIAPPPAAPLPTVSVPGMAVENIGPPGGPRALPPIVPVQQAATPPPPKAAQKAAAAVAIPAPVAAPPPAATVASAEITPAPRKPAPRPKTADAASAAVAGAAPGQAPPAAATGTNGFVAVLSSQKSRLDALKVYADIQQKFGQVLSNKPADVQEANLGDKGVYYRAVVGPPGSRDAASNLCGQLKAAGFTGCWVTAY